jgi:glycine dehydrogenase subunit 1
MAYVPHTAEDRREMLKAIGLSNVDELFRGIPGEIRLKRLLKIPDDRPCFLGAGSYRHWVPAAVDYLASRGEFNTAYTPYQPEVSQGTLQAVFEYQTLICRLTGMEIANASMYEGGTALAEAALMGYAVRGHGTRVLVSDGVHPEYRRVLATYLKSHPLEIVSLPLEGGVTSPEALRAALRGAGGAEGIAAVVVQNPNFFGAIEDGPRRAAGRSSSRRSIRCRSPCSRRRGATARTSRSATDSSSATTPRTAARRSDSSRRAWRTCAKYPDASWARRATAMASAATC